MGIKAHNWEVKELLSDEDRRATIYQDNQSEYDASTYHTSNQRGSQYGGYT